MISKIVQQRLKHLEQRIEERDVDIDVEYCILMAEKCQKDTAIILGLKRYCGDLCKVILIVRDSFPVTIEMRRASQSCNSRILGVQEIIEISLEI